MDGYTHIEKINIYLLFCETFHKIEYATISCKRGLLGIKKINLSWGAKET